MRSLQLAGTAGGRSQHLDVAHYRRLAYCSGGLRPHTAIKENGCSHCWARSAAVLTT